MKTLMLIPFIFQAVFILIDEFIFHRRRGLPRWEIWGHPLDTLTVLIPLGLAAFTDFSVDLLYFYIGLAIFSCLFTTKDEWVHAKVCKPSEQWLHAILFMLHPVVLFAGAWLWSHGESEMLKIPFFAMIIFLIYQLVYWGRRDQQQHL